MSKKVNIKKGGGGKIYRAGTENFSLHWLSEEGSPKSDSLQKEIHFKYYQNFMAEQSDFLPLVTLSVWESSCRNYPVTRAIPAHSTTLLEHLTLCGNL